MGFNWIIGLEMSRHCLRVVYQEWNLVAGDDHRSCFGECIYTEETISDAKESDEVLLGAIGEFVLLSCSSTICSNSFFFFWGKKIIFWSFWYDFIGTSEITMEKNWGMRRGGHFNFRRVSKSLQSKTSYNFATCNNHLPSLMTVVLFRVLWL